MKKTETLLTESCVITNLTSEFSFNEENNNFIDSILGNDLYNWST